jgi:hypothetical protein
MWTQEFLVLKNLIFLIPYNFKSHDETQIIQFK